MFIKKDDQFSVQCHTRDAPECPQQGEFCDSEDEAQEWVEDECWIFSGEGWICPDCNTHFMRNLAQVRRDMEQEKGKDDDDEDDQLDLVVGIETVR